MTTTPITRRLEKHASHLGLLGSTDHVYRTDGDRAGRYLLQNGSCYRSLGWSYSEATRALDEIAAEEQIVLAAE